MVKESGAAVSQFSQSEARSMLRDLCRNGFDGNVGDTALALGREEESIAAALEGDEIDEDLIVKIRGIAQERNIPIEGNEGSRS